MDEADQKRFLYALIFASKSGFSRFQAFKINSILSHSTLEL